MKFTEKIKFCIIICLLGLNFNESYSQIAKNILLSDSIKIDSICIYHQSKMKRIAARHLIGMFGKKNVNKYRVPDKLNWYILKNTGIVFEVKKNIELFSSMIIEYSTERLDFAGVKNQQIFTGKLFFYDTELTSKTTYAELKNDPHIDAKKDDNISYLMATGANPIYYFFFAKESGNLYLDSIRILLPE